MGIIHDHVFHTHLSKFIGEREFILPFLTNFDISYAYRKIYKGTQLSLYLLNPDQTIRDQFGIDSELVLAISDFKTIQPRTIQAVDDFFQSAPAKGRVDQTIFFMVTKGENREWLTNYCSYNQFPKIPIAICYNEIEAGKADNWFVRNIMARQLYARDLFNEQLPLVSDQYFFGREKLIADFVNAAKTSQNRGLFGLRKTGKTSLLFKIKRMAEDSDVTVVYYDCKDPSIRSLSWTDLLNKICDDLILEIKRSRVNVSIKGDLHVSERFRAVVKSIPGRCCIIFDEIEYVSPIAKLDLHWRRDFIPFWQTIWTTQSQNRKLSFMIAGVNPSVVETDLIDDIQNPIFAIISPEYLTGLTQAETRSMLHFFGKRMGLKFDHKSCDYIFTRYGGHPMLTRMAGSFVNSEILSADEKRPSIIEVENLISTESVREEDMAFYCRHIVNELRIFYPEEYEMLEMLAGGNEADFIEFSKDAIFIKHLESYGLVSNIRGARPLIKIPVLARFINLERMKRDEADDLTFRIPSEARANWLTNRKLKIVGDTRSLEAIIAKNSGIPIFGPNGFPETEYFMDLPLCNDRSGFTDFINTCNRCFVESVVNFGKSTGKKNYLSDYLSGEYPNIYNAFIRIRLYRNNIMHLLLIDRVDVQLKKQLQSDFHGQEINDLTNPYGLLQQVVLDGLFVGFQLEIDKRS